MRKRIILLALLIAGIGKIHAQPHDEKPTQKEELKFKKKEIQSTCCAFSTN